MQAYTQNHLLQLVVHEVVLQVVRSLMVQVVHTFLLHFCAHYNSALCTYDDSAHGKTVQCVQTKRRVTLRGPRGSLRGIQEANSSGAS